MQANAQFRISREDKVRVDYYSELMNNYFPESAIAAGEDLRSLMVAEDQPMLFYLTKEKRLKALLRSEGSVSGWIELLFSEKEVASFELEYNIDENYFQIAKVEDNKVWISQEIPLATTQFETLDKSISWNSLGADTAEEKINRVSIGIEHVLFATTTPKDDAVYYVTLLDEMEPARYTLAEHGQKIVQFELGQFLYNNGVFLLYEMVGEHSLFFQSLPDAEYDKTTKSRFETGEFIHCFTLLKEQSGNDIIYAAGQQIHEFSTIEGEQNFAVTKLPAKLKPIKKIRAARHGDERSVWALDSDGLHYQTNHFFEQAAQRFTTGRWTLPILMAKDADQFTCLKGKGIRNQLYSINTKNGSELTLLWQDAVTTLWNSQKVSVKAADSLKEIECYTAHVRFKTAAVSKTFSGAQVRLRADSNLFVYVNSESYHIGPEREATIRLGMVPEFTIIVPVTDLASADIFLNADFLEKEEMISLTGKVFARLESRIDKSDGLDQLTKPDGSSLVPAGADPDTLQGAAEGIQQMFSLANTMQGEDHASSGKLSFSLQGAGATNARTVAVGLRGALPQHGITLGDFLHAIWDTAVNAVEFVVEKIKEGIQFVIKIGEEIFAWVVKTFREIGSFIQKIFDAIKVFFKDLFEFLAFLFDWDSILATKNAFKDFANNAILSLRGEIKHIKKFIDDTLEKEIAKFSPELVEVPENLSVVDPTAPGENQDADPRANWLNSKKDIISGGKQRSLTDQIPKDFTSVIESFFQEMKAILEKSGAGFQLQMDIIFTGFKRVIFGEMTFVDFLKLLMQKLAGLSLFLVKQLMDVILVSLEKLIEVALVGLNKEWHIPLISDLYKEITKGDALTFIDVVCLFIAIPTTVLYKIGEGKAPFENYQSKEAFVASGNTIFKLNLT
ncbi:MAG: hypothetical protein AAFO03_15925 [Bacteroidota bacterium]